MRFKAAAVLLVALTVFGCASSEKAGLSNGGQMPAGHRQTTVQGAALIGPAGIEAARQAAIDDAIAQASQNMQASGRGGLLAGDIKVVDEWQDERSYYVQAVVVAGQRETCQTSFRKKILATAFPIMDPYQISGIESQDLFSGIPREISNQLMQSGDFIARNFTNAVLYTRPDTAPEISPPVAGSPTILQDIARRHDAQLVLAGVIRDFRMEDTEFTRGAGLLAELKSRMRDYVGRRSVGIDVFVYDGFTGALLFQHRYTDTMLGDVTLPKGYTVGSERFAETAAGHAVNQIITEASEDIRRLLACYPVAARVVKTEGDRLVIDAGAQNKIKPGDRFRVFSAGFTGMAGLGFTDPIGTLEVSEVGPSLASGKLLNATGTVRAGDWVRSFSAY